MKGGAMYLVQQRNESHEWENLSCWTNEVMAAAEFLAHTGHDIDPNDIAANIAAGCTFESTSARTARGVRVMPNPIVRRESGVVE